VPEGKRDRLRGKIPYKKEEKNRGDKSQILEENPLKGEKDIDSRGKGMCAEEILKSITIRPRKTKREGRSEGGGREKSITLGTGEL